MIEVGCGVVDHDTSCLCDVVIPHSTGWIDCAIQDMWMGQEIVNLRGYMADWDDEIIIKYLDDLTFAKDNWDSTVGLTKVGTMSGILRDRIRTRLQSPDAPSILDVAKELGLGWNELMNTLFTGRRYMSKEELAEFEQDVRGQKFSSAYGLGKKYGMGFRSAESLHEYWGVPWADAEDTQKPERKLMDTLIETHPNLSNKEIRKIIELRFGPDTDITTDKIRYRRDYIKRCKRPN